MQNDKTTLKDLSVFAGEQGHDIFSLLSHTTSQEGKEVLRQHILRPPQNLDTLEQVQHTVKFWTQNTTGWPEQISNGTLVMLDKFFESTDIGVSAPGSLNLIFGNFFQKLFNKNEYFFTRFSLSHVADFLKGCMELTQILNEPGIPVMLKRELEDMEKELQQRLTDEVVQINKDTPFRQLASLSFKVRREMKNNVYRLIASYARLDAWRALALATTENKWVFPALQHAAPLHYTAQGVYHPLISNPVAYDITFTQQNNFMLLTGANMSGKTTFMRTLGVAALLAHLGCGVPANNMTISFLESVITNMHVEDNIIAGESFFFAEVQRMKQTAQKIVQSGPHLVLMDELFKGTNVHDAYECTRAIVEGLLHNNGHIMVLSTHLYEVAQHFKEQPNIIFNHFVTDMAKDGSYTFTYKLREGISDDKIGYRILEKEGILKLLHTK